MDRLINLKYKNVVKNVEKQSIPVITELISTEEQYINILEKVVYGYMSEYYNAESEIIVPEILKEHNGCLIFANIAEIYEWHKYYFLGALRENQYSVRGLSKIFTQNEHHFHMYAKFSFNKTISEYLISMNLNYFDKIKKKLKHKNSIEDLMIAPVQRVVRYEMLLKETYKHLRKNGLLEDIDCLTEACNMIKKVCNEVDEFAALNGIKNFDGLISTQGKLLLHGFLTCVYDGKRNNLYVFLFKCLILFTEKQEPKRKYLNPTYNFRLKIPMNKLHLKELNNTKFSLQLMDPNVPSSTVICQAHTKEEHTIWINAIKQQLTLQINLIHELVHPSTDDDHREVLL